MKLSININNVLFSYKYLSLFKSYKNQNLRITAIIVVINQYIILFLILFYSR